MKSSDVIGELGGGLGGTGGWEGAGKWCVELTSRYYVCYEMKEAIKLTLEQATKAQKGTRGIAVVFLLPRR